MDINKEMEMILAENGVDSFDFGEPSMGMELMKPKKKGLKKTKTQFGSKVVNTFVQPDLIVQNQIQAAKLSDSLIDELKAMEVASSDQLESLKKQCEGIKV